MTQTEALRLALKAMESFQNGTNGLYEGEFEEEIAAIKTTLEAKDEPVAVAWANRNGTKFVGNGRKWIHQDCVIPLYTTPPQPVIDESAAKRIATALGWEPPRKPLTDEELRNHYQSNEWLDGVRFAEQFHGIKGEA